MTAILPDASGKMHHGILFARRLGSSLLVPGCHGIRQENLLHLSLSSPRATDGHWRLTLPWRFYLILISKFWKPFLVIYPRGLLPVVALIGGSARTGYLFQASGI